MVRTFYPFLAGSISWHWHFLTHLPVQQIKQFPRAGQELQILSGAAVVLLISQQRFADGQLDRWTELHQCHVQANLAHAQHDIRLIDLFNRSTQVDHNFTCVPKIKVLDMANSISPINDSLMILGGYRYENWSPIINLMRVPIVLLGDTLSSKPGRSTERAYSSTSSSLKSAVGSDSSTGDFVLSPSIVVSAALNYQRSFSSINSARCLEIGGIARPCLYEHV